MKAAPTVYLLFPGTAKAALEFYGQIFDSEVFLRSYAEFSRTNGPESAIAHGGLKNGPVEFYIADAGEDELPFSQTGLMLSLLGAAEPATLRNWFEKLSENGKVVEPLEKRPWGASDGQVIDKFGVKWLIGFEEEENIND